MGKVMYDVFGDVVVVVGTLTICRHRDWIGLDWMVLPRASDLEGLDMGLEGWMGDSKRTWWGIEIHKISLGSCGGFFYYFFYSFH